MKLIKRFYNYCFGCFWNNQYNMVLIQYYINLFCWFNIAFN